MIDSVTDFLGPDIVAVILTVLEALALLVPVLIAVAYLTYAERKVLAADEKILEIEKRIFGEYRAALRQWRRRKRPVSIVTSLNRRSLRLSSTTLREQRGSPGGRQIPCSRPSLTPAAKRTSLRTY